ncbi:hypothetical protein ACXR2T_08065 [Leucobacter sp. HY1910]
MAKTYPDRKQHLTLCVCGKIIHQTRKNARRFDATFGATERRHPYRCTESGGWHLGRLTKLRKLGVDTVTDHIPSPVQLMISRGRLGLCVENLVKNELSYAPRQYDISVHVAEYISRVQRTEGRDPTVRELGQQLPASYLELVSEPDEDWIGTDREWCSAVQRATVMQLALQRIVVIDQGTHTVQIGPRFAELLDAPPQAA